MDARPDIDLVDLAGERPVQTECIARNYRAYRIEGRHRVVLLLLNSRHGLLSIRFNLAGLARAAYDELTTHSDN